MSMSMMLRRLAVLGLALVVSSCSGADDRYTFGVEGSGVVAGFTYLDMNRDGSPQGGEARLAGVDVHLLLSGTREVKGVATTDSEGEFRFEELAPGSYRLEVQAGGPLGDSLVVTGKSPATIQVGPTGTAAATVGVSFPLETIPQAGAQPAGVRLYLEGIALNARGSLPDNAVHLWDGERSIRTLGATFTANAGDSIRILGRTALQGGRAVLTEAVGFRLAEQQHPVTPVEVSTQQAATAGGGGLDAALVRLDGALVSQAVTVSGIRVVTASDGSGPVTIRIPNAHLQQAGIPILQPGAVLSVTGLLIPQSGGGTWELRTRSGADVSVEAQGTITGRTFFDRNGDLAFDGGDLPLAGIRITLFRTADASAPVTEATSDADGRFRIGPIDVDEYRIEVDPSTVPDSLVVRGITPETFVVPTADSVSVTIPISFPQVSTLEARSLSVGTTIFLQGIALNSRGAFGDLSVHLQDGSGALRAVGLAPPNVLAGDRVRFRGTLGTQSGQPVLLSVTPLNPQPGGLPSPLLVSSAVAATASGGTLDADQVRVREAEILSASGDDQTWVVVINDGSGPVGVEVRLSNVGMTEAQAANAFQTGRVMTATGLMMPQPGTGQWRIRPRTSQDISFQP
jgi:hypothetical protein